MSELEHEILEDDEDDASEAEESSGSSQRGLTHDQFVDASVKWKSGRWKLKDIADMYGVSNKALSRRFKRQNVVRGSDSAAFESVVRTAHLEETLNATAEREARLRKQAMDTKDFLLKAVDGVSRRGLSAIVFAVQNKLPISTAMDDVKTAKEAILLFKNAVETIDRIVPREEQEEDDLPSLAVVGLEQSDLDRIRQDQKDTNRLFGEEPDSEDELDALSQV